MQSGSHPHHASPINVQHLLQNQQLNTKARNRSAFTLMELMLVLVLLLTIASVVMPAMSRWQQAMPLDQATTLVRNELTRTRVLAIDEASSWSIQISADGQSFQRHPTQSKDDQTRFELPSGVHFTSTSEPLHFQSDGTTSDMILVLEDAQGIQQHLKLDRLTGTIRKLNP